MMTGFWSEVVGAAGDEVVELLADALVVASVCASTAGSTADKSSDNVVECIFADDQACFRRSCLRFRVGGNGDNV